MLVAAGRLVPHHWRGSSPPAEIMPPALPRPRVLRSTHVSWRPPDDGWIKLNTDGSFTASEDGISAAAAGGGGVVRGPDGVLIAAFCTPLRAKSSFEAELMALLHGLRMAHRFSHRVWIEMDSAAVVAMLKNGQMGSAEVRHPMAQIRGLLNQMEVRFTHIYREGNRVADYLAGRGVQTPTIVRFDATTTPRYVKALVRMDRLGFPNFRFRYKDA